ncbi:hypothetical protein [Pseudofulvibacter geojedonensis]|uniref:Phosphatidate cytidylyltransferase n=1 Tax=Pseudofulvibacter geojedonensis TaxID=1123758 RepID=A0ABW3I388_9FLAO
MKFNEDEQRGLVQLILAIVGLSIMWLVCYFTTLLWVILGIVALLLLYYGYKDSLEKGLLLNYFIVLATIAFFIISSVNGVNPSVIILVLVLVSIILYQMKRK